MHDERTWRVCHCGHPPERLVDSGCIVALLPDPEAQHKAKCVVGAQKVRVK